MNWIEYFLGLADLVAQKSKDPSTQVGAVIVYEDNGICSTGYNGFPRGVADDPEENASRYMRPAKYLYTEHAERNAIYNAAKQGHSTEGAKMYVQFFPCAECARAIIQAGIKEVYTPEPDLNNQQWGDSWFVSGIMLAEAKVKVHYVHYTGGEDNE